jgi:glycosyltransferase involved in cell wall biosynthesis
MEINSSSAGIATLSSVDVIVPCYRYGRFLRQCVASVLAEPGLQIRVLIIDDASPDETPQVAEDLVRADSRIQFRRHESNAGHIATYNEGIAWASADYMVLLSADDYLLPGALQRSCSLMDRSPSVGFTFGGAVALDDQMGSQIEVTGLIAPQTRVLTGKEFIELSAARNIVIAPTVVVRTSLQKRLGGYLPALTHSGDMEMWLRFAAHADVGFIAERQAVYRRHAANMSRSYSPEDDLLQRKAAIESFVESCRTALSNPDGLRKWLLGQLAREAIRCASSSFNEGAFERSEQLCAFAVRLDPDVRRSRGWWSLWSKRRLGLRAWRLLQPSVNRARKLAETRRDHRRPA